MEAVTLKDVRGGDIIEMMIVDADTGTPRWIRLDILRVFTDPDGIDVLGVDDKSLCYEFKSDPNFPVFRVEKD